MGFSFSLFTTGKRQKKDNLAKFQTDSDAPWRTLFARLMLLVLPYTDGADAPFSEIRVTFKKEKKNKTMEIMQMGRVHVHQTRSKIDRESSAEAAFRLSLFPSLASLWRREEVRVWVVMKRR